MSISERETIGYEFRVDIGTIGEARGQCASVTIPFGPGAMDRCVNQNCSQSLGRAAPASPLLIADRARLSALWRIDSMQSDFKVFDPQAIAIDYMGGSAYFSGTDRVGDEALGK